MTITELIDELENARLEKGVNADVIITFQKPIGNGMFEMVKLNILEIISSQTTEAVGIWVGIPSED